MAVPSWRRILVLLLILTGGLLVLLRIVLPRHIARPMPHLLVVGQAPSAMAVDQVLHHLFVLNFGDGTVSMIDTRRIAAVRTLAVGGTPNPVGYGLAIAPTSRRVFVVDGGRAVRMLDARTGALLRAIRLPVDPFFVAVDNRAQRVFVSESNNFKGNSVVMLDARTGTLLHRTIVGAGASALAADERTGHVFVLNIGANTVSMLDARTGALLRTIPIAGGQAS